MMAVLLATRRAPLASTRREEPHCQHRSSRGKVDVLTTPTWPHDVHSILTIMVLPSVGSGERATSKRRSSGH
jgi:hypothetical protein